jgi:hypothetical protein
LTGIIRDEPNFQKLAGDALDVTNPDADVPGG